MDRVKRPLALFGISFALKVFMAAALHFDGLYGQDAFAYYSYGQQIRTAIAHFQMPGHFYWPLGYPALAALSFGLVGERPLGPQLVSLIAGALVSVFAYLMAETTALYLLDRHPAHRRLGRIAGIIAWAITTACGQLNQSSFVIMSDAAGLMWASLSAWALLVYGRSLRPHWIALSAFALAWATMTRWQYASLAVPWALFVLVNRPVRWRHTFLAFGVGIITLIPQAAHSIANRDLPTSHEWVQGWSISNFFARDFVNPDGTFHYAQSPAVYYAQPLYNPYYMSPLFGLFVIVGLVVLRAARPALLILLGWSSMQYVFLIGVPYENIRFALALFPPLAVIVGIGAARLILWRPLPRLMTILIILYGVINTLVVTVPMVETFVAAKNNDLATARWIEAHIPHPDAPVFCIDLALTMQYYTALHPVQIYEQTPEALSTKITMPAYAVFNLWTTEHQWYGKSPWIIYHWLKSERGLTELGTFGGYTLYRINR